MAFLCTKKPFENFKVHEWLQFDKNSLRQHYLDQINGQKHTVSISAGLYPAPVYQYEVNNTIYDVLYIGNSLC